MGGQAAGNPPPPSNNASQVALLNMQGQAGRDALARQSQLQLMRSRIPVENKSIDLYGPTGVLNQMSKVAAINDYKSKELEKTTSPETAAMRSQVQSEKMASLDPAYWQNQMGSYSKKLGI